METPQIDSKNNSTSSGLTVPKKQKDNNIIESSKNLASNPSAQDLFRNNKSTNNDLSNSIQPINDFDKNNNLSALNKSSNSISFFKNQNKQPGIMERMKNFMKKLNPWRIEEEEFIDAHGFVSKRPKKKIPLRNKKNKENDDIQKVSGDGLNYATKQSGFGNLFL